MSTISSLGVGSGLDAESIVTQLMSIEKQSLTKLQTQESAVQAKISAFGDIKSLVDTLGTKLSVLKSQNSLSSFTTTNSNTNALTVTTSSTAKAATYAVTVNTLAKPSMSQISVSDGNSATSGVSELAGAGTLSFTVAGGTPATVTLNSSSATLGDWRDAINNANVGVTATVLATATGAVLKIQTAKNGDSLSVDATSAPAILSGNSNYVNTAGTLASFSIDGINYTADSNTVTSTIPGVTLKLLKAGESTNLEITPSNDAVTTAVNDFITSYNALNTKIKTLTAYDSTNKKASTLTGDATVRNLQNQITTQIASQQSGASGTYSSLAELGISFNKDGSMSLDSTKLSAAVTKDNTSVLSVLTAAGSNVYSITSQMTQTGGLLDAKSTSLQLMVTDYKNREDALNIRLTAVEKRYRSQFSSLDTIVAGMKTTSSYLTQMISKLS